MLRNSKHMGWWLAIAVAIGLLCPAAALAAKPVSPPPRFSVLELPLRGDAVALNESDGSGVVTVVIQGADENGYTSAAFARVDATARTVLGSGFLPEPRCKDPNGTNFINGWSEARDVNDSGAVVGVVLAYDETLLDNRNRAILWTFSGQNYTHELLPCLLNSVAYGINNAGDIVGAADGRSRLVGRHEPQNRGTQQRIDGCVGLELAFGPRHQRRRPDRRGRHAGRSHQRVRSRP